LDFFIRFSMTQMIADSKENSMTRKHFKLIADQIAKIAEPEARMMAAQAVAAACRQDNPRFDPSKFYEACGV